MIPISVNYSTEFVRNFETSVKWFVDFLDKYSVENSASKQILILSTDEYYRYMENIQSIADKVVNEFSGTCAYCNSKDIVAVLPIHPIEKNRKHPWLAAEVRNFLPFCSTCKSLVGVFEYENPELDQFIDKRFEDLIYKRPNVLIPVQEPSHLSIKLNDDGFIKGTDIIARRTIKYSGINRQEYVVERQETIRKAPEKFKRSDYEQLWSVLKVNREDRAFDYDLSYARSLESQEVSRTPSLILEMMNSRETNVETMNFLGQTVGDSSSEETISNNHLEPQVELKSFQFDSLRALEDGVVDLSGAKCLGIVGENGVGKSTLLDFISFCVRGTRKKALKNASDGFICGGKKRASASLVGVRNGITFYNSIYSVKYDEETTRESHEIKQKIRLAYIGESRVVKDIVSRSEKWLSQLNDSQFNVVASQLKQVFGIEYDSVLERDSNGLVLIKNEDGLTKPLSTWSSGYKSILSIVYSIYQQFGPSYHLQEKFALLDSIVGMVFIDEIELHLHPRWKISLVSKLKRIFPDVFFVFTTHDPLVLKGCKENEVLLVKRTVSNKVDISQDLPDISRTNSDKILTSRYFGLGSTTNLDDNTDLIDFYNAIQFSQKDEISSMIPELKKNGLLGTTYREMVAFMCVDKSLANNKEVDMEEVVAMINERIGNIEKD